MKIGLTGLASKIGVYSHERGPGREVFNSVIPLSWPLLIVISADPRQHRLKGRGGSGMTWQGVIIVLSVCLVWHLICSWLRLINIAFKAQIQSDLCEKQFAHNFNFSNWAGNLVDMDNYLQTQCDRCKCTNERNETLWTALQWISILATLPQHLNLAQIW